MYLVFVFLLNATYSADSIPEVPLTLIREHLKTRSCCTLSVLLNVIIHVKFVHFLSVSLRESTSIFGYQITFLVSNDG